MSAVMNVNGTLNASYTLAETLNLGFVAPIVNEPDAASLRFVNDTSGPGKIDLHIEFGTTTTPISLASGAHVDYDLAALTDGVGRTVALQHLAVIYLRIISITAGDSLTLKPSTTNPLTSLFSGTTPAIVIKKLFVWGDDTGGIAVASGSACSITITNAGSAAIGFIVGFAGTSA